MADSFLHRWFGGPGAVRPSVEQARAELDRRAVDRPAYGSLWGWLREMLPELVLGDGSMPSVALDSGQARAKLTRGIPLLRDEPLVVDPKQFQRRWRRACETLEVQQPDGAGVALAEAVGKGKLDPAEMVAAVLAGRPEDLRRRAEELGLDVSLTTTVLRFTLFPVLTALEASLAPLRDGAAWDKGYCPTCGCWPLLGEFRGLDQSRFLRCGLCAASWEVPRLWCCFCGNRDHDRLGSLHQEGEEAKYRAAVCELCRGYVKMLSVLSALPPLDLLVADALTLHLDLAAAGRGYANPP